MGANLMRVWQLDRLCLTPYYDRALCQALADAGYAVELYTAPYPYDAELPSPRGYGLIPHVCPSGGRVASRRVRQITRLLTYWTGHRTFLKHLDSSEAPDVVHIQWSRLPYFDVWLVDELKKRRIPIVHTVHDVSPLFRWSFERQQASIYAAVDRLVVHTQESKTRMLARYPHLADKLVVIPHIALSWPEPPNAARSAARQQLGLPNDAKALVFCGTARAYKGLDILVEAMRIARRAIDNLWLIVAGQIHSKAELRALRTLGESLFLCPHYVPSSEWWVFHRAADVAVFPYRQVTQSGALITAMGFGLPVVASDVGGFPETVAGNGVLVPPENPVALAGAIERLFTEPNTLAEMGERSLDLVRNCHAPQRVARDLLALYQSICVR